MWFLRKAQILKEKVKSITECIFPENIKQLRSFLGFTNYYRRFIKDYSKIAGPLLKMTRKNAKVCKTEDTERAFNNLKNALIKAPILKTPEWDKPFRITTDASLTAIGGVLEQYDEDLNIWRPVRFGSKTLNEAERNYGASERECYAVVYFLELWRDYISGNEDTLIITDCAALGWLFDKRKLKSKFARWILSIQDLFPLKIQHKPGFYSTCRCFEQATFY